MNQDPDARCNPIKQLRNVLIAHANAPVGAGNAHRLGIRGTVYVNKATKRIDPWPPITLPLSAAQPENAGQYPVSARLRCGQLRRVDLTGGSACYEHGIQRHTTTDHGAYKMLTARRATAGILFSGAIQRGGYPIAG